ncbi:hypothetical protein Emed_007412 [Eimeria media]
MSFRYAEGGLREETAAAAVHSSTAAAGIAQLSPYSSSSSSCCCCCSCCSCCSRPPLSPSSKTLCSAPNSAAAATASVAAGGQAAGLQGKMDPPQGNGSMALVAVGTRPHPKCTHTPRSAFTPLTAAAASATAQAAAGTLFGRLLALGAMPLHAANSDSTSRSRRSQAGVSKLVSDRELRRLQLPCLLAALMPPPAPLEDADSISNSSSSGNLPLQQQALVVRGAASLVLQQWLLLAADVLQLLRRLLQPEKQHRSSRDGDHQQHRQQQQQDARRKRVRTAAGAAPEETAGLEAPEEDEAAEEALWTKTVALQQQQREQDAEESQQRLRRLGSVFASHLQHAESSVRAQRESSSFLLQRGGPDLFGSCWAAALSTPLRSGDRRLPGNSTPQQQQQQQLGSHERVLAAAAGLEGGQLAPGMSWRRWAFGAQDAFPSAAAAASHAAAAADSSNAAAAAEHDAATAAAFADADADAADFGDMWGHLPEEQQQQQQQFEELPPELDAQQDHLEARAKASRRKGGHLVQMDTSISRKRTSSSSSSEAFPTLLWGSVRREVSPGSLVACKYLKTSAAAISELYTLHPVACLYRRLQQLLLQQPAGKSAWGVHTPQAAAAAAGGKKPGHRGGDDSSKSSSTSNLFKGLGGLETESELKRQRQRGTGEETLGGRRSHWEGDFTLYTEAELQQQQQQQQQDGDTYGRRGSGDVLGSSEYVEVLRGLFDSSSMQQRATQTRILTQPPRVSDASSVSRLGSSKRTSRASGASSEASFEALAFGEMPYMDAYEGSLGGDDLPHWGEDPAEAMGADVASTRLKELLQQYASRHPAAAEDTLGEPPYPQQQQQQQQQRQQQQRREGTIPLSRLLPRGRVDPRTACCTFSHLLLLHSRGAVKLEQQQQQLETSRNRPYPEVYVHIMQQPAAEPAAEEAPQQVQQQQQEQQQQQQEQQQQQAPHSQPVQSESDQPADAHVSAASEQHEQQESEKDQQQQQEEPRRRGRGRPRTLKSGGLASRVGAPLTGAPRVT